MPTNNIFSYSSNPLPIKPNKKKYKDDEANLTLMSDPRVVRGMVSTSLKKPLSNNNNNNNNNKDNDLNKNKTSTSKLPGTTKFNQSREINDEIETETIRPGHSTYYYDVRPLVQSNIDVSRYLIEDPNRSKPQSKVTETQTDEFKERPDTPEYIPRKTGIDRSTQVEDTSELFIFDEEVQPMLHVIVSKTIEQSLFELEREEELKNLEAEIEKYHYSKLIEAQWIRKREEETIADTCIKDLALKGMKEKAAAENAVRSKVASRQTMLQIIPNMIDEITSELFENGTWRQPGQDYITHEFLPNIYSETRNRNALYDNVQELLDEIIWEANQKEIILPPTIKKNSFTQNSPRTVLKLILPKSRLGTDEDVQIGPIPIGVNDSVSSLEEKIQEQLTEYGIDISTIRLRGYIAAAMGYNNSMELNPDIPLDRVKLPQNLNIFI
mmetsp:Transcript_5544/g.5703  ORF Transcript_5544/g.5703 Transcript_5544/m.5703 type:complete len:439 (+) Transcript_5544:53-1369(+)